ncbi:Crp/Fnr family transcriptional regulator [Pedobacter sp. BMA]|uniref:Crp/Fnr family transcriptional regulator n=1 Tax=Pedobacter sp. BMA TaxID=1663685 RepID=UPI000B04D2CC|nr:Crp/Fnr family transcriptional regulator [Pedobacter sp. BMA]
MFTVSEDRHFMKPFFNYLEKLHPLSPQFMECYELNCQLVTVRKNKFILSPIDSNNAMYFLLNGLVRGFIRDGKKDISTWFGFEGEIVEAMRHPEQHSIHSMEYLQALEDCELIRIPYSIIDGLFASFPEATIIARKLLKRQYYLASERSMLARIPTALGRYLKLESMNFDICRIPQRYLASYLGMRLETLSRIRNREVVDGALRIA